MLNADIKHLASQPSSDPSENDFQIYLTSKGSDFLKIGPLPQLLPSEEDSLTDEFIGKLRNIPCPLIGPYEAPLYLCCTCSAWMPGRSELDHHIRAPKHSSLTMIQKYTELDLANYTADKSKIICNICSGAFSVERFLEHFYTKKYKGCKTNSYKKIMLTFDPDKWVGEISAAKSESVGKEVVRIVTENEKKKEKRRHRPILLSKWERIQQRPPKNCVMLTGNRSGICVFRYEHHEEHLDLNAKPWFACIACSQDQRIDERQVPHHYKRVEHLYALRKMLFNRSTKLETIINIPVFDLYWHCQVCAVNIGLLTPISEHIFTKEHREILGAEDINFNSLKASIQALSKQLDENKKQRMKNDVNED